jgi:hypothetical protein
MAQATLAQTSGFTYQGKLGNGGAPANGTYQFECKLFDIEQDLPLQSSIQIGATQTVVAQVQNGIFTMRLDFGAASFAAGQNRWLEIGVRLNGTNDSYTVFSPRQQINSVPFAVRSLNATTADNATQLGGVSLSSFVQTSDTRLTDARMPTAGSANYIQNTATQQTSAFFNISGDGTVGGILDASVVNATHQFSIGGFRVLSNLGNQNLFAGVGAGQVNIGNVNAFFGKDAGLANTSGSDNSFFGWSAGAANTGGSFNSFFGVASGLHNKTGSHNSFFGDQSGIDSTGNNNSFFGGESGFKNTQGSENSFFGLNSGEFNTTGDSNSSFGLSAGQNNSTGDNNTFLGSRSGASNTSENNNTFIGTSANGAAGITNATAIGFGASVTQSNSLVLGSINGTGAGTADTNVGVGTTAPLFRFHVKTGTDQNLVVRPAADFGGTAGIALQSVNDANSVYLPLDLEGSKITMNAGSFGRVGIGTTAPGFKLEVVDGGNSGLRVQTNAAGGTVASFGGNGVFQIDAPGIAGGRLKVTESGQTYIPTSSGLVLRSPNNSCWAVSVSDAGALSTTSVPCP